MGHSILVIAYDRCPARRPITDLGPQYFDERERTAVEKRLVRRLEALGNKVTVEPIPA